MSLMLTQLMNQYNIYNEGEKLIGVDASLDLPELSAITETLSGAGVMGSVEVPATGQFDSTKVTINFNCLDKSYFGLVKANGATSLTFRGSEQCIDTTTGETDFYPVRIVMRGKASSIKLGTAEKGKKTGSSVELEIFYLKIEIDGETNLELDKLNFKFVLNGEDQLAKIRAQI